MKERFKKLFNSLQYRIFLSMFGILVISSFIIIITSIIQYREEAKDYNLRRLARKERALKESIRIVLDRTTYPVTTENIPLIFNEEIHRISNIHNLNFEIYDLEGRLLTSSLLGFGKDTMMNIIPVKILDSLNKTPDKTLKINEKTIRGESISSYSILTDKHFKPIGILHIPYLTKSKFYQREMREFLNRLSAIYIFLIILSIIVSFYLSKYITKSHAVLQDKLTRTDISTNQKIELTRIPEELKPLVESYNKMVDKLEESRRRLIQAERESAWRDMAKQVAHEIKNPLTPMRLSIEHFINTFDANDPDYKQKLKEFGDMMIEQILLLNKIAQTFSDFTKISEMKPQKADLVDTLQKAVMLYPGKVFYDGEPEKLEMIFDKGKINQVLVNLIRNALQAEAAERSIEVHIRLTDEGNQVRLEISDNGTGIPRDILKHIFEPRFTTKSSGMGLGLVIVKRIVEGHGGQIFVRTEEGIGTKFIIFLPKKTEV